MTIEEYFSRYSGHFVDVKLKGKENFIKVVFWYKVGLPATYIDADIVENGDEEEYISKYITQRDTIKKISIGEGQILKLNPGRRLADGIPKPPQK